jgi:hypothetical protein
MSMLSRFATTGGGGDPYWSSVSLLLQGGTLSDSSSPVKTITNNGGVTVSTSQYKWAPGSLFFTGSGTTYLSTPDSSYFNLSGGNYTIEFWVNPNGNYPGYSTIIGKRILGTNSTAWSIGLAPSTGNIVFFNGTLYSSTTAPTTGIWNFIAVVYDGTNINIYCNSARILSTAVANNNVSADVNIGSFLSFNEQLFGYLDDVRVTKGVARYTGSTMTVPTAPFPIG